MKKYTQKQFKELNEFNQKSAKQSEIREETSAVLSDTKSLLLSKQAEYETVFKAGVLEGTQDQSKLSKLNTEIEQMKKAVEDAEKTERLTYEALPDLNTELPAIVEKFRTDFTPSAREDLKNIEERLQLGFDLILSARLDHISLVKTYQDITAEVEKHSKSNKDSGRTDALMMVSNPVERLEITPKAIIEKLVDAYNRGVNNVGFNYIHETPKIKEVN